MAVNVNGYTYSLASKRVTKVVNNVSSENKKLQEAEVLMTGRRKKKEKNNNR